MDIQGMDKITETAVKDIHFFINMKLGRYFPVIQFVSFFE